MDYGFIRQRIKDLSNDRIKKFYQYYVYQLMEEIIPYTKFSQWYIAEMQKELGKRGYKIKN